MQQPTMHHSIISPPHTTDTPQDPLYPVCTVIYKIFDGVQYEGQLHKYYPHRNVYFVRYLDGDSEEIDEQHLKPLLRPKKNKKITSFIPHQPQIHHAIVPNPSTQFNLDIDINRLRRSRRQHFHILDTTSFSNNPHTLYILGHTGNQYIITVNNTITCSCPDSNPACKHILFLLELLGQHIDFSITPQLSVSPHDVFHSLYVSPPNSSYQRYTLDYLANELCTSYHSSTCYYCNDPLSGSLLICSRCAAVNHTNCVRNQHPTPTACPVCGRPYSPFHSPSLAGFRNFYNVLKSLRYPVHSPLPPPTQHNRNLTAATRNNHPTAPPQPTHTTSDVHCTLQLSTVTPSPTTPVLSMDV